MKILCHGISALGCIVLCPVCLVVWPQGPPPPTYLLFYLVSPTRPALAYVHKHSLLRNMRPPT